MKTMDSIIECIKKGNNYPVTGCVEFLSTDHIRFQNGLNVSGHNYGCTRKFTIESNIYGGEGYTVTLYNMDGIHPIWQNNIQMAPKQMKIISADKNVIDMRGFGHDDMGVSFANYGVTIILDGNQICQMQLNMFDRGVSIVYFK